MAVNLTPQYHKAQDAYRRAASVEEELKWLEVMYKELPKHKASEKVQSDLKTKISAAKKALEGEKKTAAAKAAPGVNIPRQGAGTCILLGGPNAGKSRLLAAVTRATPEVAPYPYTTRTPLPGMMPWEDCVVQLIDTPPITDDLFEPYMQGLIRGADVALLMVDLGSDDGIEQCQSVLNRLNATKTRLAKTSYLDEEDVGLSFTQTLLVPNKIDLPEAADRLAMLHEFITLDLPEYVISAETGDGVEALRTAVYQALDVVRVYAKNPKAKAPDLERPFTVRRGQTVLDVAEQIHKDLAATFKFAKVWGHGVHDGTPVKGDHVVHDKDIVEIHA
ncbi:MAG: TGS domain-containing protein [Planctomycetales bacterium]|nr:TGS domain-containing protein [Planctomycetales bacterium]